MVRSYQLPFRSPVAEELSVSECPVPVNFLAYGNWDRLDLRLMSDGLPPSRLDIEIETWDAGQAPPPLRALTHGTWQVFIYQLLDCNTVHRAEWRRQ